MPSGPSRGPSARTNLPSSAALSSGRVTKLNATQVRNLVDCIKSPRAQELESYQSYFDGTAYDDRPNFFTDSVPMQDRKPCVQYPLVRLAVLSNAAFAMGEGRFPFILSLSSEGDDVFDKALGLSRNDSEVMDSFNARLIDLGWFERAFREAYKMAQASRSCAMVLGFRDGLPFIDTLWPKLCRPTFDPVSPNRVTRLEIRYRYTEQWRDPVTTGGEWWTKVLEYLRVIDGVYDTVYEPVEVWDTSDPGVIEGQSPTRSVTEHGFGLCPVHWYARNRACATEASPDGVAVHDGARGLVEQADLALSQRHRAAVYTGDPLTVISGADPDEVIGGAGRAAQAPTLPGDQTKDGRQWQNAFGNGNRVGTQLRRGAGQVWKLQAEGARADLLCLPGDALTSLKEDAKDLVSMACDTLGITIVDPAAFGGSGDLSGRTLAFLFSKQTNRVSEDREDLKRCCILPVLNLFYQMLLSRPTGIYLPGLAKVLPILARFKRTTDGGEPVWFAPMFKLKWGDFFEPSDVDESTRVSTGLAAWQAGGITLKTFVEHVRSVFAIGSVDQYVDALLAEKKAKQDDQDARDAKKTQALQGAMSALNSASVGDKPPAGDASVTIPGAAKPAAVPKPKRAGQQAGATNRALNT